MKDEAITGLIQKEITRQNETINLIPSENYVSQDVLDALGSPLTNKYAEGYPGARYYGGNQYIDEIENLARVRALALFNLSPEAWHVNVQPYSGSPANLAVYAALVPVGGTIMGLQLDMGGHLTHGHKVSFTAKAWRSVPYTLNKETELLDFDAIRALAEQEKPAIIVAGFTAYPRIVDFAAFRKIADAVGAKLLVDMSHFAGLVAGGAYPSPFPYADVVMTTAHKSLRGPRAAIIFAKKEFAKQIDKAIFPGLQGGPHANQIAAIAVALKEAMEPSFKTYAAQIVANAHTLAETLTTHGFRIISGGTDTHLLLVDTFAKGVGGKDASNLLEASAIIANMNTIPYDPRPPMDPSGIRLGTPALTTRGMKENEMKEVARFIAETILEKKNVCVHATALAKKFPLPYRV